MSLSLDPSMEEHGPLTDSQNVAANEPRQTGAAVNKQKQKQKKACRYYGTEKGCRAGAECPFLHIDQSQPGATSQPGSPTAVPAPRQQRRDAVPSRAAASVVKRPVPASQTDDPRAFQVGQIQRRFKPDIAERDGLTVMTFKMKPSDPDFPYEIENLECVLQVPSAYPGVKASLNVTNQDIPRGFQINLEKGFDTIVQSAPTATLLTCMNRLDNRLESILSGRMAKTITIVSNKPTTQPVKTPTVQAVQPATEAPRPPIESRKQPTADERSAAAARRSAHSRQLEARFGRLPSYSKSVDGRVYTLPLDSPKKSSWPSSLQSLRSFDLVVPDDYPLETPSILLDIATPEAHAVERGFTRRCKEMQDLSLTQRINDLTQHFAAMASTPSHVEKAPEVVPGLPIQEPPVAGANAENKQSSAPRQLDDREHLIVIPRPPEWSTAADADDLEYDSSGSDSTDGDAPEDYDDSEDGNANEFPTATSSAPAERGILMSFPHIELHGIELLELTSLDLTVKCERCKDTMDVQKVRNYDGTASAMKKTTCMKCATGLAVGFRADLLHVNSARAGYIDLEGCTVIDMLPSHFIPTCAECSTAYPAPGIVAVRGDSSLAICRECHHKMTLRIPEAKFLQVSAAAIRASRAPGRKMKENLGITAGSELPRRGRCTHYSKSFRWFRFSCCAKVFACDRCHDEQANHPNEHANRMICGYCSREQNFRPEDCSVCHAVLIGKRGHGFWEGGKGTRDPARMSKKDPRKYKRRPGTAPRS